MYILTKNGRSQAQVFGEKREEYNEVQEDEGMPCAHEHDSRCYIEAEHCTHEHTEECYSDEEDGDYDIMATPSNLGKATSSNAQERNAEYCYHICDEYSGCISEKQLEKTGENQWVVFLPNKSRTYVFNVSYAGNQYYQVA